jgi:hypothetical protein
MAADHEQDFRRVRTRGDLQVIRFSAVLVVVAIGVLIGGIATSKLLLVYVAIGLSAAALVALAIGVVLKREELFSEQEQALPPAAAGAGADEPLLAGKPSTLPNGLVDPPDTSLPAGAVAAFGQAARGAERSGQDRSGRPAFGEPGYGQAAPPATQAPLVGDWSGRMARPAPAWRERPSPGHGDAAGSRPSAPPEGSPPAAPGWPPGPSWFDRPKAPAGPELPDADEGVTAEGAPPEDALPEDVVPEDVLSGAHAPEANVPEATVPTATVQEAGTAPRADAAHAGPSETAEPGPGADAATDGPDAGKAGANDAGKAGANDAGSSEGSPKQVTVVQGVPRYHDEDCILIRFMGDDDVQKMTVRQATEAGCTPCRACHSDTEAT